jgi:hypothetical protein
VFEPNIALDASVLSTARSAAWTVSPATARPRVAIHMILFLVIVNLRFCGSTVPREILTKF